jgi:hypothetical protein
VGAISALPFSFAYFFLSSWHMSFMHLVKCLLLFHSSLHSDFWTEDERTIIQYPGNWTFSLNAYLPVYVMRRPTIPNSVLSTKPIANLHCSPDQYNTITVQNSHFYTIEGIRTLQDHMNRYMESLPQIWYPKDIHHKHNLLEMSVTVQHHINFQVKPSISITCYRNNPLKCHRVPADHCCTFSLLLIWIQQLGVNVWRFKLD